MKFLTNIGDVHVDAIRGVEQWILLGDCSSEEIAKTRLVLAIHCADYSREWMLVKDGRIVSNPSEEMAEAFHNLPREVDVSISFTKLLLELPFLSETLKDRLYNEFSLV